jgi:predicted DNA-binding WGR domain protein
MTICQPYYLYVERTDPACNMARYYAMSIEPTLFGPISLSRRWGRIGTRGQETVLLFDCEAEAVMGFLDLVRKKRARGYRPAATVGRRQMDALRAGTGV